MQDYELDCLRDLEYEKAWEELNALEERTKADQQRQTAVEVCRLASKTVDRAVELLCEAAEMVGIPETDRIASLANDLENLNCDIGKQIKRMED